MEWTFADDVDLHHDLDRIMQRFDRLEEKLDRLSGAKQ
jgi:hypothetical protein